MDRIKTPRFHVPWCVAYEEEDRADSGFIAAQIMIISMKFWVMYIENHNVERTTYVFWWYIHKQWKKFHKKILKHVDLVAIFSRTQNSIWIWLVDDLNRLSILFKNILNIFYFEKQNHSLKWHYYYRNEWNTQGDEKNKMKWIFTNGYITSFYKSKFLSDRVVWRQLFKIPILLIILWYFTVCITQPSRCIIEVTFYNSFVSTPIFQEN